MKDILKEHELSTINKHIDWITEIILEYVFWAACAEAEAKEAIKANKILEDFRKTINSKAWTKELEEKLENIKSIIETLYSEIQ